MKTIIAAIIASSAFLGAAHADTVTGTLKSFDQVTGTIVLDNGQTFGVEKSVEGADLIRPIRSGTVVKLDLDGATKLVTDIVTAS